MVFRWHRGPTTALFRWASRPPLEFEVPRTTGRAGHPLAAPVRANASPPFCVKDVSKRQFQDRFVGDLGESVSTENRKVGGSTPPLATTHPTANEPSTPQRVLQLVPQQGALRIVATVTHARQQTQQPAPLAA